MTDKISKTSDKLWQDRFRNMKKVSSKYLNKMHLKADNIIRLFSTISIKFCRTCFHFSVTSWRLSIYFNGGGEVLRQLSYTGLIK